MNELEKIVKDLSERVSKLEDRLKKIEHEIKQICSVDEITLEDVKNAITILERFERYYRRWDRLKSKLGGGKGLGVISPTPEGLLKLGLQFTKAQQPAGETEEEIVEEEIPEDVRQTVFKLRNLKKKRRLI